MLSIDGPVLVLCPHPDDEVACAGTIHRLIKRGAQVHCRYFSTCAESTQALGFAPEQLIAEFQQSMLRLGIPAENVRGFDFPVRKFPQFRQEILEQLVAIKRELQPSLVFAPNSRDVHQDHNTIFEESRRAFKHATILGYECPWNNFQSANDVFVALSQEDLDAKLAAWALYRTQRSRDYSDNTLFSGLASMRGMQVGKPLAEAFESVRIVL